jgi:glycosyltransferase involved in cell wall biosynthesis
MKPLHICHVCSEYPPSPHGGIGSFTQTLSRALAARGHRVTVVGLYPEQHAGGESVDEGVNVIRLSRRGLPFVRFLTNREKLARRLRELHSVHPIDVIEGGELELCLLNRSAPGIKILRMHGGPTYFNTGIRIQVWKESWAFRVADELCAVSRSLGEGTRQMLGL